MIPKPPFVSLLAVGAVLGAAAAAPAQDPSESQRLRWTCGHLGVPCAEEPPERLSVRVTPRRATAGRVTRFRVRVTRPGEEGSVPVARAAVRFAGARVRTDRRGRAVIVRRLRQTGQRRLRATRGDLAAATARIVVRSAR